MNAQLNKQYFSLLNYHPHNSSFPFKWVKGVQTTFNFHCNIFFSFQKFDSVSHRSSAGNGWWSWGNVLHDVLDKYLNQPTKEDYPSLDNEHPDRVRYMYKRKSRLRTTPPERPGLPLAVCGNKMHDALIFCLCFLNFSFPWWKIASNSECTHTEEPFITIQYSTWLVQHIRSSGEPTWRMRADDLKFG